MAKDSLDIFETDNTARSVLRLALPSVAGQIVLVIYNAADTYFIGLTESEAMISSVTVCMPAFMILSAVSNLFGIGAGAAFSRALGRRDEAKAFSICAVSLRACIAAVLLYSAAILVFMRGILIFLGARDPSVNSLARVYLTVTVVCGGLFTSLSTYFAHMLRSEGRSVQAGFGIMAGGFLNIALDPLFMLVIFRHRNAVYAVALATAVSNTASFVFFTLLLLKKPGALKFKNVRIDVCVLKEIAASGLPAFLMTLFENISYAVLGSLMAACGVAAQAGIGVAKKINMLAHSTVRGLTQGVMPLIAYSYSSKNLRRLRSTLRTTYICALSASLALSLVYFLLAAPLVDVFLPAGTASMRFGAAFLRILCLGCPFSAFAYTAISVFQAIGQSRRAFFLAVLRKGALDIPLMHILRQIKPVFGIVAATPVSDAICCAVAAFLLIDWASGSKEYYNKNGKK